MMIEALVDADSFADFLNFDRCMARGERPHDRLPLAVPSSSWTIVFHLRWRDMTWSSQNLAAARAVKHVDL